MIYRKTNLLALVNADYRSISRTGNGLQVWHQFRLTTVEVTQMASVEQPLVSNCEKCKQGNGKQYTFHFGTKTGEVTQTRGVQTTTTTRYAVHGSRSNHICDECISKRRRNLRFIYIGIVLVGVALGAYTYHLEGMNGDIGIYGLIGFACLVIGGVALAMLPSRISTGERLAYNLNKKELSSQGDEMFWDTEGFNRLT